MNLDLFETACDGLMVLWRWRGNEASAVAVFKEKRRVIDR
jgi:hypothetical protein